MQCYQSKCLLICKGPSKHEKGLSELNLSELYTVSTENFYHKGV